MLEFIYNTFQYFISNNVPSVKNMMLYIEESDENRDPIRRPYVELEFVDMPTEQFGNGYQQWVSQINLHVSVDVYGGLRTGADLQSKTFGYLSLIDTIYEELNGICSYDLPESIQSSDYQINEIIRNGISFVGTNGNVKTSIISFNIVLEDYSLVPETELGVVSGWTYEYTFGNRDFSSDMSFDFL